MSQEYETEESEASEFLLQFLQNSDNVITISAQFEAKIKAINWGV